MILFIMMNKKLDQRSHQHHYSPPPSSWPQEKQKNSETVSDAKAGVKWEEFLLCFFVFYQKCSTSEFPRLHTEVWNNKSSTFQTLQVEQFFLFQEASFLEFGLQSCSHWRCDIFQPWIEKDNIPGGTGSSGSSIAGFEGILCQGLWGVEKLVVAFDQKMQRIPTWFQCYFWDLFWDPGVSFDRQKTTSFRRFKDWAGCLATHLGRGGRRHFSDSEWCPGDLLRTVARAKVGEHSPVDVFVATLTPAWFCEIPRYTGMGGESGGVIGMMEAAEVEGLIRFNETAVDSSEHSSLPWHDPCRLFRPK